MDRGYDECLLNGLSDELMKNMSCVVPYVGPDKNLPLCKSDVSPKPAIDAARLFIFLFREHLHTAYNIFSSETS